MVLLSIPKLLFSYWFWFAILFFVWIIHYFWGKTPPPPKPNKFFIKHKKTISKVTDIFIILFLVLLWTTLMVMPITKIIKAFSNIEPTRTIDIKFAFQTLLINIIPALGWTCFSIGFLSFFQTNITKAKRVILLGFCLLPVVPTIIELLITDIDNYWMVIRLCLMSSSTAWIINFPAIIMGKPFTPILWSIMQRLRLVSGDFPG